MQKSAVYSDITLVITACRRFDLLAETIASMQPWIRNIENKILVEDSDECPALLKQLERDGFMVIVNGKRLGQHAAIDKAYQHVQTTYIFHCEEDWEFIKEPNFAASKLILENGIGGGYQKVSCVCYRNFPDRYAEKTGYKPEYIETKVLGTAYKYALRHRSRFNSFNFNPGMLKRSLLELTGAYDRFKSEGRIARFLQRRGYILVRELPGELRHLGDAYHIPRKPRTLSEKIKHLLGRRVYADD